MSMDKLLSQDEIDALLKGMDSGEVASTPEQSGPGDTLVPYDFLNQDRIVLGRMPTLEIINSTFCRHFRTSLSGAIRKAVDVSARGIEMVKFGDFIKTLPVPSSLHIFRMEPLRGLALMAIEAKLVFTLIDLFFGGTGKTAFRVEGREFTAIETKLIKKVAAMIFTDLERSWHSIEQIHFRHMRSEINPQFANIVAPGDIVINITFEIELDKFSGAFVLSIPYAVVEPIKDRLYSVFQGDKVEMDHTWVKKFQDHLLATDVELKVELGRARVMIQDLVNWKEGDIIPFNQDQSSPAVVKVQGMPKFLGKPGTCHGCRAVRIEGRILSS